ncbi:MAG TPA: hypothetical protein VNK04_06420 [Gemmataceae bacterium]|nr:hypothetical protein [Gemmataceae bacterium]
MSSGANHSRLTSLTYPNGRVLNYNYSAGLDDHISRLSSLFDNSATLESYDYLGLATVVRRAHPQPSVDLTYIKQAGEANGDAGDPYTGLDRFGRVVDQRWRKGDGSHTDRFAYGYDRNSNRLYRQNLVDAAFSELYHANGASEGYDLLNQLTAFRRGVLSDSNSDGIPDTVTTASRSQEWQFDALGNWSTLTTDGTPESRSHNRQNQITAISGQTTPAYDNNGNLTTDQMGKTLVYDAWNRLVKVKDGSATLVAYTHNALNRRVTEDRSGTVTDLYYSDQWQVLEERVSGTTKIQYVWSPVYVDALVLRDRDADGNAANGLEERLYVQQDANWNVTALVDAAGNVVERYVYNPFGAVAVLTPSCRGHVCFSINGGGFVYICATVDQFFTCRRTQRIVLTILPLKAKPTS